MKKMYLSGPFTATLGIILLSLLIMTVPVVAGVGITDVPDVRIRHLTVENYSVSEGGVAKITVSLDLPALVPVEFDIATVADGSAEPGKDYIARNLNSVSIPANSSSYTFEVQTLQDDEPESSEDFSVFVTNVQRAVVVDDRATVSIIDDDGAVPPRVAKVSVPPDGTYGPDQYLTFTVAFDASIYFTSSGGTPSLPLIIGSSTVSASLAFNDSRNLVFVYKANFGDEDPDGISIAGPIQLNGATVENAVGTPADLTLRNVGSTSGILVSTTRPAVLSTSVTGSPPSSAANVEFEIVFSQAVTGLTVSDLTLTTTGSATGTISGLRTADNITYVAQVDGITGQGTLRMGVPENAAANAANWGNAAFTSGTPWTVTLPSDASLSALVPSEGSLSPAFTSGTFNYSETVANSVLSIKFSPTASDPNATITVNGLPVSTGGSSNDIMLAVGTTPVPITVTAQDGTTKTYVVAVTRESSSVADLINLVPSVGTLSPAFDAAVLSYNLVVGNDVTVVAFSPTASDPNATITVNGLPVPTGGSSNDFMLLVSTTPVVIVVTAQDGVTQKTYIVNVMREASSVADLANLVSSVGTLSPAFSATTLGYSVSVDNAVDSIQITPTAADTTATITVNGSAVASGSASPAIPLAVGTTPISIVVTAQDGTTKQTYEVSVTRAASAIADLSGLVPSAGTLSPAFDAATLTYALPVGNSVDSVTFTPTTVESNSTIAVNGTAVTSGSQSQPIPLAVGSTAVNVVVTAQDGTTKKTYTVSVARAGAANAALNSLVPSAGTLSPAFTATTLAYRVSVENTVDSISLTSTLADTTATVTVNGTAVASGSASAAISLAVGTTQIPVVVTAQDGTTKQTYLVSVVRKASAIADLSGLVPSVGSLDPAFSASTYSYSVTVANNIETIAFTPTALDGTATISVNGSAVASGVASPSISIAVGTTNVSILVTAQDGTTTKTYSVSVIRSKPLPTAASRTIEVVAGSSATVDLTEGATGSPFTTAALTTVPGSNAGTTHLNSATQQLTFDASPTFSGSAGVGYTLTNAAGTSAPAIITFAVIARPDPSKDPEVIGLLRAQVDAAKRFAQYQTRNFNNRLEQLHDEGDRRRNSMDIRLGYRESGNNDQERRDAERRLDQMGDDGIPGLLGYADGTGASHSSGNPPPSPGIQGPDFGPYAVWTGGFIDFAERDKGGLDIDSTAVGISAGVDYRFSPKFVAGFGIGYGHDKSDVGDNGTESRANAYSAAIYGSYKPIDHLFIDGLIGGSWLDYDSRRYVTANGEFADGQRDGKQLFGSLTAAYELRDQKWLVSPYGRFEMSRSWLDGFTEKGGGIYGLTYGDQTVDTVSGVVGIRASYDMLMDWGKLTPGVRAEFTHDFAGSSRINLGYTDIGTLPYALDIDSVGSDYATLGLSLDAAFLNDWMLGLEYRTAFGSGRQDHAIGLKIGAKF